MTGKGDGMGLGDRMKDQYENRTRFSLPRRTNTIIRLDGRAFHSFTRNCRKPYDRFFIKAMQETAAALLVEIQGAKMAYVQSDEISILLTDYDSLSAEAWFDGNVQKITSISASIATAVFNSIYQDHPKFAHFDSRVFTIPDTEEVVNYFVWRQKDWIRNSIQMLAQSLYSQKQLQGKKTPELHEMIHKSGKNWADCSEAEKNGTVVMKATVDRKGSVRTTVVYTHPIFTQSRDLIRNLLPNEIDRYK